MSGAIRHLTRFMHHPLLLVRNVAYWRDPTTSPCRHLFVVGVSRSGTTLLKSVLVAHPQVGGSDYESTGIFGLRDIFAYTMGELPPEEIQALLATSSGRVAFYDRVVGRLLERQGKEIFADKLQLRAYRLRYVARHFPNSRFIHLVRDGRDGYCSALGHPNVRQSRSAAAWARYWALSVATPAAVLPTERLYTLRYEDLTAEPEATVRALMGYAGLPFAPQQVDVSHYARGTQRRRTVHANLARPISARSQGRWRDELSDADVAAFARYAGDALERFGYERGGAR